MIINIGIEVDFGTNMRRKTEKKKSCWRHNERVQITRVALEEK